MDVKYGDAGRSPGTLRARVNNAAALMGLLIAWPLGVHAQPAPDPLCTAAAATFNARFVTTKGLDSKGDIPIDSGVIVHTIHGPGKGTTELNLKALNALPVAATDRCGDLMNRSPPVFMPWCGSNKDPSTHKWSDSSSWSYVRTDTLINGRNAQRPDEVVCADADNKRYGLIFSNAYLNVADNLGCMYPLDGDTGNRAKMGCGISQNVNIDRTGAQGRCAPKADLSSYLSDFKKFLMNGNGGYSSRASYAGSLVCSLARSQFDLWVAARKSIDLSQTAWPVDEFVLWNWDTYTTADLAKQKILVGFFYLTGCSKTHDGTRAEAQAIADLYKKWSGIALPVVNLSNAALRNGSKTPFTCN